jgi:acetyl esterase/lipase
MVYLLVRLCFPCVIAFLFFTPSFAIECITNSTDITALHERTVPLPYGVSPEMTEIVKRRKQHAVLPVPATIEAWLDLQKAFDQAGDEAGRQAAERNGVTFEVRETAGVRTYIVTPREIRERFAGHVFIHAHGGAFVFGGGDSVLREAVWAAHGLGVKVVSVDYRRPPLYPFPAAIDDVVAVWQEVIKDQDASKTALFGTSAGGNIVLATVLKLKELEQPLPGAVFAGTPATDLENVTDTWYTLEGLDPLGPRKPLLQATFDLYAGDEALSNPLLSPINGDLKGFPPTILISGTRDLLLSDTVRMHRALRKAGVEADLHVYDGQTHADYLQNLIRHVPECEDAQQEVLKFFDKHLR